MADDVERDETQEGGEQKKSPLKLIIILLVAVLVLGAAGFFGWQFFLADEETPAPAPAEAPAPDQQAAGEAPAPEAAGGGKEAPQVPAEVMELEPFIVNLADPSGKRYLKLQLAVDAKNEELKKEIQARMPQIRDSILLLLTSKSYSDIAPVAGKIRLRNEILKIINRSLLGAGSVHAVYFTEFVVQ
jgi:flagellar FliL protein